LSDFVDAHGPQGRRKGQAPENEEDCNARHIAMTLFVRRTW